MNWSKAKTVLIFFFVIINVFLFYTILGRSLNNYYVSKETVNNTVEILKNSGITIDKDIIPRRIQSASQFEADNIIVSYEEFAKKMLGENYLKISETEFKGDNGSISYYGDKFIFKSKYSGDTSKNESNLLSILNSYGITLSDYTYVDGCFKKNIDGKKVYDCELNFDFTPENELIIYGVWFQKKSEPITTDAELKSAAAVLVDFLSEPNRPQGDVVIENIELGYMIYETENFHKSIVPISAWEITLSSGEKVYLDARSNN